MRNLIILLILFFGSFSIHAQNRANIWELGAHGLPIYLGYYIDFNPGYADTVSIYRPMNFFNTNASVCDTTGQILFYTNGVYIANRNHDSLMNTEDYNPGYWTDFYDNEGMGIPQGAIILPTPGNNHLYNVFSVTGEFGNFYGKTYAPLHLSYSQVDMSLDSGLGGITIQKKNIHLINDTLTWGRLTACKHANGRDWWLITHKYHSDEYFKLEILPDTILQFSQNIGNVFTSYDPNGMAVFSPDGLQYAHLNMNDTIELLQFDRCSGEFNNPIYLVVPDTPYILSATVGCSFSSNSQYLYVNSYRRLWQFDTYSPDINASLKFIDSIDIYTSINWLYLEQAAPDGKIYISTYNSDGLAPVLHVINSPDSIGTSANFLGDGFILPPGAGNFCVPNFPNYELGPLEGSPCDTLFNSVNNSSENFNNLKLKVLPNPNTGQFTLQYHLPQFKDGVIQIININGEIVSSFNRPMWSSIINVDTKLSPGIYLVKLRSDGRMVSTKMIVE